MLLCEVMVEGGKLVIEIIKVWGSGVMCVLGLVCEVCGVELFDVVLVSGKGVIIVVLYLGCWELFNYWLCSCMLMVIFYWLLWIVVIE